MKLIIFLIWAHFIADFLLQSNMMAQKKSESIYWLSIHSAVYGLVMMLFGWKFGLINGFLHFIVDGITSRINKGLWKDGNMHWFFVGIGADQAIHITTLIMLAPVLR